MQSYSNLLRLGVVLLGLSCGLPPGAFAGGFPMAWGTASSGITNPPANFSNLVAISSGMSHVIGLTDDGTVVSWGLTTPPPALSNVRAIAAGWNHNLALLNNGRVISWPDTNVPSSATSIKAIAAGEFHSLAVKSNGTVVAWGGNPALVQPPPGLANVKAVAAGNQHSLALLNDGTVVGWGQNLPHGQATPPFGLRNVTAIAAGSDFSLALRSDGSVVAWGNLAEGRDNIPAGIATGIAAGFGHCVAVLNTRRVVAWGANLSGQTTVPANASNVVQVAAGNGHSVALRWRPPRFITQPQNLTVAQGATATLTPTITGSTPLTFRWRKGNVDVPGGTNLTLVIDNAQLSDEGPYTLFISNLVGTATSASATLTVNTPVAITEHPQAVEVVEGTNITLTVSATGSIPIAYQWRKNGTNLFGALSSSFSIAPAKPEHSGNYQVVVSNAFAVRTSAVAVVTVHALPRIFSEPQSQTVLVGGSVTFQVGASNATAFQWRKNGTNLLGATLPLYAINNSQLADAGTYTVLVSNEHGSIVSHPAVLTVTSSQPDPSAPVVLWGENPAWTGNDYVDMSVPGGLANVTAIAAGSFHQLALFANGTVLGWGDNFFGQAGAPPTATNLVAISAGEHHSLALTADGRVIGWGRNNNGQLTIPSNLTNVVAISAGGFHNLAITAEGKLAAWGRQVEGQINVGNVSNVVAIAAGWNHSLALLADGTVRGWGNNDYGKRLPPLNLSNVVAISAGYEHSLALKSDGTVVAWGRNNFEQVNVPSNLTQVIAIAAGANHSLALRRDGTVFGWGHNNFRQTETPAGVRPAIAIAAGGARSLALKGKRLRMLAPEPLGGNRYRLWVINEDGSNFDSARANRISVHFAGNAARPLNEWPRLNNPWTVSGPYIHMEDSTTAARRFYVVREDP